MRPRIHAWIVNYNSAHLLKLCLPSIRHLVDTITILDNSQSSSETQALRSLAGSPALIFAAENLGFGRGMNEIARQCSAGPDDIIWLVNPDTELIRGDLSGALECFSAGWSIVSPLLIFGSEHAPQIWFAGGTLDTARGICSHVDFGKSANSLSQDVIPTLFMTGAAPLMRKSTWDIIGGFRDDLFLYWEDVSFSLTATRLGMTMCVDPSVILKHEEGGSGGSSSGHSEAYYRYNAQNRLVVCGGHHRSIASYFIGPGMPETAKVILRPMLRERSSRIAKTFAAVLGTLRGASIACRDFTRSEVGR